MKKIHLLILIGAGILSFLFSFGASWFMKKNQPVLPPEPAKTQTENPQAASASGSLMPVPKALNAAEMDSLPQGLSERELENLIQDIRGRMQEYRSKEKKLSEEAERIQLAHQSLQEEIDRLNQLRNKISVLTQTLDEKEQAYKKTLLQIETIEQSNFQRLAATYDKMETTQASRILANMAAGSQSQDAIKILYYMTERTAAKVLGEIGTTQPDLAAMISIKLKRVQENG